MRTIEKQPIVTSPAVDEATSRGSDDSYVAVRFNAMKHGILSRYTMLSHEDGDEYRALLGSLIEEHQPGGATEAHLVEELAGIMWRKRRVLQAEGAAINRGLLAVTSQRHDRLGDPASPAQAALPFDPCMRDSSLRHAVELAEAMRATPDEVSARQREALRDLQGTQRAAVILKKGGANAYADALDALMPATREYWHGDVESGEHQPTSESFAVFIADLLPIAAGIAKEVLHHDAIAAQTLGDGLQAHRLEKLNRYETHLDRKFERTLAMLLKLKQLRCG